MKKFLLNTSVFLCLVAVFFSGLFYTQNKYLKNKTVYSFEPYYKNLLLGHSYMEVAVNDSLLDYSKNIAYQGESYFYTFFKLKLALEQNKNIKNVYIEFTNNQVLKRMEKKIYEKKYLDRSLRYYMPFFKWNDYKTLLKLSKGQLISVSGSSLLKNFIRIINDDYKLNKKLGNYLFLDRTLRLNGKNKKKSIEEVFSIDDYKTSITYLSLKKIENLCKSKNVNLVFVRSPLHNDSSLRLYEKEFLGIKEALFSNIEFIDNFNLSNDSFADKEHLNYKGARVYTKYFKGQIEHGS